MRTLPIDLEIHWVDGLDSQTLSATMNSRDLVPELLFGENFATTSVCEVPGRKLLGALMLDSMGFLFRS